MQLGLVICCSVAMMRSRIESFPHMSLLLTLRVCFPVIKYRVQTQLARAGMKPSPLGILARLFLQIVGHGSYLDVISVTPLSGLLNLLVRGSQLLELAAIVMRPIRVASPVTGSRTIPALASAGRNPSV